MTSAPRLRAASPDEVPVLQAIERSARRRYAARADLAFVADAPGIAPGRLASGPVTVAEIDGEARGYVLTQFLDGALSIANLMVADGCSGRGIGAALIAAARRAAVDGSLSALTLATFRTPPWNGPWFRRQGFETMPEAAIGPGLAAVLARHATVLDMTTRETLWMPLGEAG